MKFNGSEFTAKVGTKSIADRRTLTISTTVAEIDVSTADSLGWKEIIGGQRAWTGSATGIVDYIEGVNEAGLASLMELEIARAPIAFQMGGAVTGWQTYAGNGIVLSVEVTAEYESTVEWTMEIGGTGPLVLADVA